MLSVPLSLAPRGTNTFDDNIYSHGASAFLPHNIDARTTSQRVPLHSLSGLRLYIITGYTKPGFLQFAIIERKGDAELKIYMFIRWILRK